MKGVLDMAGGLVSFIFGLGVVAGVVITLSGWAMGAAIFDADDAATATGPACMATGGQEVAR